MIILRKIKSATYWLKYFLFQRCALPGIKKDQISKFLIGKYLPHSPVVVDCGAHDGKDTLEIARILKAQVHAFEPVPEIFNQLLQRTKGISSIKCYQLALSNITGKQLFYISDGKSNASSSLLEPKEHLIDHPDIYFKRKIEVNTISLDDWALANNISKIDLLWLDMQGFELQMLEASPQILNTVSVIHTEVSMKETYNGVELYPVYRDFLKQNGFEVLIEAIPSGWGMGNVLFVKKKTDLKSHA